LPVETRAEMSRPAEGYSAGTLVRVITPAMKVRLFAESGKPLFEGAMAGEKRKRPNLFSPLIFSTQSLSDRSVAWFPSRSEPW
jgi:hypothetical protein